MEYLPLIGVLLAGGALAGIIAGALGVGGGVVLVPVFFNVFSALGYQPAQLMQICVATSTGTIVFTALRSARGHHARGALDLGLVRLWGPFIVLGSVAGVFAATTLRSQELQLIFSVIGMGLGLYMLLGREGWRIASDLPGRLLSGAYGAGIGFLSALMGIGGGAFTVPLLTAYGVAPHRAVGTSPGFGVLIAVPALVTFMATGWGIAGKPPGTLGHVNLPALAIIVSMTFVTVPLGVALAHRLSPKRLRLVFALTILGLAANMLRKTVMG